MTFENQLNQIKFIDPSIRLKALHSYMKKWVDEYPNCNLDFDRFFLRKHSHLIEGTTQHAKHIATHCYYCESKFKTNSPNRFKTIDHFEPQSKYETQRIVICCFDCNNQKGGIDHRRLLKKMIQAHLQGLSVWGYYGKKLKEIIDKIQIITNDILYNTGPKIYYIKK